MPEALTARQNEAYDYIVAYNRDRRSMPTLREIGAALGNSSPNATSKLIEALIAKGYLVRTPFAARGLQLTDTSSVSGPASEDLAPLPLLTRLSSSSPSTRRTETLYPLDARFLPKLVDPALCVIVRAGDDGMNGEGIRKNDFVVVLECDDRALSAGDLAAFVVGDTVQIRAFDRGNGRWHLRTANRGYPDASYQPNGVTCSLLGKAVTVIRRLG